MLKGWSVVTVQKTSGRQRELKKIYGDGVIVSYSQGYNLIHLDSPDAAEIRKRVEAFNPEDLFEDDCPLCRVLRDEGVDVIYMGGLGLER